MDKQIAQYAEATAALVAADPEMRLRLRAQVVSRVQERVQVHLTAGTGWKESVQCALRDLGAPAKMAGDLSAKNLARMVQRRQIRWWCGVLLGAMLLVYAWVQYAGYLRLRHAIPLLQLLQTMQIADPARQAQEAETKTAAIFSAYLAQPAQRRQAEFLFFGERTRHSPAEQQRAIWEAHPDNAVYFANYAGYLLREGIHTQRDLAHFTQEMRRGMQLDPDNAYYHYLLADALAGQALAHYDEQPPQDAQSWRNPYQVTDRRMLEQAIAEVRLAASRRVLRTYHQEMLQAQFATLPAPRYSEDYLLRITLTSNLQYPELQHFRALTRAIPYLAHFLAADGRKDEAEALLRGWLPMSRQFLSNGNTLRELLVATACMKTMGQGAAAVYDEWGAPDRARQLRADITRISEPYTRFRADLSANEERTRKLIMENGALHVVPMIPVFGGHSFTIPELTPTRNVEFLLLETLIAGVFLPTLLFILLLRAALIGLRWSWSAKHAGDKPFMALLPLATWCRILGYGVLLPLALYYLHTRCSGFAWREHSLIASFLLIPVEMIALAVVLLILPARLTRRAVHRHCTALGMPTPKHGYQSIQGFFSGVWALIWVLLFFCLGVGGSVAIICFLLLGKVATALLIPLLDTALLVVSVLLPGWLRWRHPYGQFYGTLAKTRIPIYAGTLLLVCLLALPYLDRSEQYWLRTDRLIYAQPGSSALPTPIEHRVTGMLREEMLQGVERGMAR